MYLVSLDLVVSVPLTRPLHDGGPETLLSGQLITGKVEENDFGLDNKAEDYISTSR